MNHLDATHSADAALSSRTAWLGRHLIVANLILAALYSLLSWMVAHSFEMASPVWPAAALSAFAALIGGWILMPGIALGSWLSNAVFLDWSPFDALVVTAGNILAPMFSVALFKRVIPAWQTPFDNASGVAWFFLLPGMLNGILSALIGTAALIWLARQPVDAIETLMNWASADITATLMLTPAMLLWWSEPHLTLHHGVSRAEARIASLCLLALAALAYASPAIDPSSLLRALIPLLMLPLVWIAIRFPQRDAYTLLSLVFVIALSGTLMGRGVFSNTSHPFMQLQIVLAIMGAFTLLAGALVIERKRAMDELNLARASLEIRVRERTQQLRNNLHELERLFDTLPVPTVITHIEQRTILFANHEAAHALGYTRDEVINQPVSRFVHSEEELNALRTTLLEQGFLNRHEVTFRHRNGELLWMLLSAVPSNYDDTPVFIFSFQDISLSKQREFELEQLVSTDVLTGLATRRYFMQRAGELLRQAQRNQHPIALFILDLDHFKSINDTYGHATGDIVLRQVSASLGGALRPDDLCGRIGGEEFAVILTHTDAKTAMNSAQRLRANIHALDITLSTGQKIHTSISIGGVLYHPQEHDIPPTSFIISELLQRADQALYAAKHAGRNRVVFADDALHPAEDPPTARD